MHARTDDVRSPPPDDDPLRFRERIGKDRPNQACLCSLIEPRASCISFIHHYMSNPRSLIRGHRRCLYLSYARKRELAELVPSVFSKIWLYNGIHDPDVLKHAFSVIPIRPSHYSPECSALVNDTGDVARSRTGASRNQYRVGHRDRLGFRKTIHILPRV